MFLNLSLYKYLFFFLPTLITLLLTVLKQSFTQPCNQLCMVTLKSVPYTLRFQLALLLLVCSMCSLHIGCKMPLSVNVPGCSTNQRVSFQEENQEKA